MTDIIEVQRQEIKKLRTEIANLRAEQRQCADCDPAGKAAEVERLREKLETARFFIDSLTPYTEYNDYFISPEEMAGMRAALKGPK
jgi:hypothetical protein